MTTPLYESPWTANPSEWWVTNPGPFIDICFDAGIERFVFTEKVARFIANMRLAPERLMRASARGRRWRAIIVEADNKTEGYFGRVAIEYTSEGGFDEPVGVYPVWHGECDDFDDLRDLIDLYNPGREIGNLFGGETMAILPGQHQRIIFRSIGKNWEGQFTEISRIKAEFPHMSFHYHGGKSVARTIGVGVDAFDHPTRIGWIDGFPQLLLPNGKTITKTNWEENDKRLWSDLIGRKPKDVYGLDDRQDMSRAAYQFNLLSLKWLVMNYDRVWQPDRGGLATDPDFDYTSPDVEWTPDLDLIRLPERLKRDRYDRWLCDSCSVALSCPYARPGAVCIVEDSATVGLVEMFRSRKSADIVEGLSRLVAINAERAMRGLQKEIDEDKISPAVTKLIDSTFDRGVQLAKLRDPAIAQQMGSGSKVQIGINAPGAGTVGILQASNPAELMAGVAAQLEEEGIAIEDASEEDVKRVLGAIEAEASG